MSSDAEPISSPAFRFYDSPEKISHEVLFRDMKRGEDSLHELDINDLMLNVETGQGRRYCTFRQEGKGSGLKDFAKLAKEEGLEFDREFVYSLLDSKNRLATLAAQDVMESVLQRFNFYFFGERELWKALKKQNITFGPLSFLDSMMEDTISDTEPFGGSFDKSISYVNLWYAYGEPCWTSWQKDWFLFLMERVEEQYLADLKRLQSPQLISLGELRDEIWHYLSTRHTTARNDIAHIFCQAFQRVKRPESFYGLTNNPRKFLDEKEHRKLMYTIDSLRSSGHFSDKQKVFRSQLFFLKSSLQHWRPSPRLPFGQIPQAPRLDGTATRSVPPIRASPLGDGGS